MSLGETSQKTKMGKDQAKICYVKQVLSLFLSLINYSGSLEHLVKRECEVISRLSRKVNID